MDVIILAAGNSVRFGTNKLLEPVEGIPMYRRTADKILQIDFETRIVVTQYREILEALKRDGFLPVENREPGLGISHSIALGLSALKKDSQSCMFLVCDQPFLSVGAIQKLKREFEASEKGIGAAAAGGEAGNPVVFSADYYRELAALTGDRGGKRVLKAHPEDVMLTEVPERELADIDTRKELDRMDCSCRYT